jgi:hypothetical protein
VPIQVHGVLLHTMSGTQESTDIRQGALAHSFVSNDGDELLVQTDLLVLKHVPYRYF